MFDDRLSREVDREIFEAIVPRLVDPELARLRRIFLVLCVALYAVGTLAVGMVAGLGGAGVLAFSSTFLPGVAVAQRLLRRRFTRPARRRRGFAEP